MKEERQDDINPTDSAVLKARFGPQWRLWAWLRKQFTVTSLSAIAAIGVTGGGYITNLKTRVVILETEVVPVIKDEGRVDALEATVVSHGERLSRLEGNWDDAKTAAGTPPVSPRRRK